MIRALKWIFVISVLMYAGAMVNANLDAIKDKVSHLLTPARSDTRASDVRRTQSTKTPTDGGQAVIYAAEEKLKSRLRDPQSVRFGKVYAAGALKKVACGSYNARTNSGSYGAIETFVGNASMVVTESDLEEMDAKTREVSEKLFVVCDTAK